MLDRPNQSWPLVADIPLDVRPDLSAEPWSPDPALEHRPVVRGVIRGVALLPGNAAGGHAAAEIFAVLADGTPVVVEATWQRLHAAVHEIAASPTGRTNQPGTPRQEH